MLLYIHIPFCDSKCHYCAFNSYVDKFHLKQEYMSALYNQISYELKRFEVQEKSLKSIFLGGGTPSCVESNLYEKIFTLLKPYINNKTEITTEANPNSASKKWLSEMYKLGVNRVSFGVQSFDDDKLKMLNRAHNATQAINAIKNAHDIGIQNISLDIIYATINDSKELLQKDLNIAFSLPINHLSAYALTIEEKTPFEHKPQMANEKLELTKWLFNEIEQHNFKQYEISNFGTYQSIHNKGYWLYDDYIGAGSGAVGKLKNKRFYPSTDIQTYINNPLHVKEELLNDEDTKLEKIFLGFRSCVGVEENILSKEELKRALTLTKEKKLTKRENKFYNENYLLADELALFLTS